MKTKTSAITLRFLECLEALIKGDTFRNLKHASDVLEVSYEQLIRAKGGKQNITLDTLEKGVKFGLDPYYLLTGKTESK